MLCLQASDGAGSAAISDLPMDEFKTASALLSMIDEQGVLDMEGHGVSSDPCILEHYH